MQGWGVMCLILGIGTFVLPMFDMEFRILSMFGEAQPIVAIILIVLGAGLVFMGWKQNQSGG